MDNNFVFDTTKFVLDEVKKEALKTAIEELAPLEWSGAQRKRRTKRRQIKCSYFSIRAVPHKILCK